MGKALKALEDGDGWAAFRSAWHSDARTSRGATGRKKMFLPSISKQLYQSAGKRISNVLLALFIRANAWMSGLDHPLGAVPGRIEDEQCQRIGGGYEAMKFRFLLFL